MSRRHRLPNRGKGSDVSALEENTETSSEAVELTDSPAAAEAESPTLAESSTQAEETEDASSETQEPAATKRRVNWSRVFAFGVLPALALVLAIGAGFLKWVDSSVRDADVARAESVQTAKDSTVTMLSYKPDTVDKQLNDARNLLTGEFQASYTGLINDVVIPGAKQKQISAVASVPAAASVSAEVDKAVVLVFVNQTVVVGQDAPTSTASSVRVTLRKIDGRWLIEKFDPV